MAKKRKFSIFLFLFSRQSTPASKQLDFSIMYQLSSCPDFSFCSKKQGAE